MVSFITVAFVFISLYCLSVPVAVFRNYLKVRNLGFHIIICPVNPNHPLWMILSVPFRGWLKRNLPETLFDRFAMAIYGWDYHEKRKYFVKYNTSSIMLVTASKNALWTVDNDAVADVLKRNLEFTRNRFANVVMETFGPSVLTSDGEPWARQRKMITSVINERISKVAFDETWKQSQEMIQDIEQSRLACADGKSDQKDKKTESPSDSAYANVFPGLKRIASNVLFRSAYGAPQSFKKSDNSHHAKDAGSTGIKLDMFECIYAVISNLAPSAILPTRLLLAWPSILPLSGWAHRLGAAKDQFSHHLEDRMNDERKALTKLGPGESRSNLMSMLLQALEHGSEEDRNSTAPSDGKNQSILSEEELRGNLFIFTTAGFETTANALSFALVALMTDPKWQDWLFEEIDTLFDRGQKFSGQNGEEAGIDYVSFYPKAIRCLALMMETLRIYPPVVQLSRNTELTPAMFDIKTSEGMRQLPADTAVNGSMIGLHTDPKVWRNLNICDDDAKTNAEPVIETMKDALEMSQDECIFRPSRWVNPEPKQLPDGSVSQSLFQPPKGSYIPFLGGPRTCPGQKMAQVEFVCVILALFREYRIEAVRSPGESDSQVRERLQGVLKDCHAELTLIMDCLHEVGVKFIRRTKA